MSRPVAKEDRKQLGMYDPERHSDIQYEVVKLPLQDQVAVVRKAICSVWRDTKAQWNKVQTSITNVVSRARTRTQDSLKSVGIKDPVVAMEITAVGSAAAIGYLMARKKSLLRRILYPTLGVTLVGGAIYFSLAQNRADAWDRVRHIHIGYLDNIPRSKSDNKGKGQNITNVENSATDESKKR